MATYRILSWHGIPAQIRAEDTREELSLSLPPRFQELIDLEAMNRGLTGSDEYLDGWQ